MFLSVFSFVVAVYMEQTFVRVLLWFAELLLFVVIRGTRIQARLIGSRPRRFSSTNRMKLRKRRFVLLSHSKEQARLRSRDRNARTVPVRHAASPPPRRNSRR